MASLSAALSFPLGGDAPTSTVASVLRDAMGVDILFTDDTTITPAGDYQTVGGHDNLRLALLRRLITRPGTYRLHPEYGGGIGDYLGKPNTQATRDQLRQAVLDQLSLEPRVESVEQVEVQSETINGVRIVRISGRVKTVGLVVNVGFTLRRSN